MTQPLLGRQIGASEPRPSSCERFSKAEFLLSLSYNTLKIPNVVLDLVDDPSSNGQDIILSI